MIALTACHTLVLAGSAHPDFDVPSIYNRDGLLILAMIKRVMEGSCLYHSALMGAPFGTNIYDCAIPKSDSLPALRWLSHMYGSAAGA